ncbi:MAG: sigma-70 family RNA polymerase sigma factor [Bacteroidaceae bacterium]|nr:sigma-70 family RNA polymerase sigma factor [Bacteroidaceae bacterium]
MIHYDKKTFEQIYKSNYRQMYRFAYSLLEEEEDARDAVSQAFTQLWHNQPQMKADALTGYLLVAVRNLCLNTLRKRRLQTELEKELKTEQLVSQEQERQELMDELARVIKENLSEKDRQILSLHYDEELTYAETAKVLDISPSAVNKHITQSLAKIRSIFKTANL